MVELVSNGVVVTLPMIGAEPCVETSQMSRAVVGC
jgi:hypothetical protein